MQRDVFKAIADPTRRGIINLIAHQPLTLNTIAENFKISRPAISQQIKILMECGLIEINQSGRERYCEAKLEELHNVADWVGQYNKHWAERFDLLYDLSLESKGESLKPEKKKKHKKKKNKK